MPVLGLPLYDVYHLLLRLSHEGILSAAGSVDALQGFDFGNDEGSVQESMQEAFAALDANDDAEQRRSAIDRVFGDEGGAPEPGGKTLSALDKVFGGPAAAPANKPVDLDRELLDILRKGKKG